MTQPVVDDYELVAKIIRDVTSLRDKLKGLAADEIRKNIKDAVLPLRIDLLDDVLNQLEAFQEPDDELWQIIHRPK